MKFNKFVFAIFLSVSVYAKAQTAQPLPEAPTPKIWDATTIFELSALAGAASADALSTQRLFEFPKEFGEANPLAKPFVHTRYGQGLLSGFSFAGDVYGTYLLRKHNHPRYAHIANWSIIALESVLAVHNYRQVLNSNVECGFHHPVGGCIKGVPQP